MIEKIKSFDKNVEVVKHSKNNADLYIASFTKPKPCFDYLMRFSEFIECDVHKGEKFNHAEYKEWYEEEFEETYENDIQGWNLPSSSFDRVYTFFSQYEEDDCGVTKEEEYICKWFESIGNFNITESEVLTDKDFYFIGLNLKTTAECGFELKDTLKHELSHFLYYTDEKYEKLVNEAWRQLSTDSQNGISNILKESAYVDECHPDEACAFFLDGEIPDNLEYYNLKKKDMKAFDPVVKYYKNSGVMNAMVS